MSKKQRKSSKTLQLRRRRRRTLQLRQGTMGVTDQKTTDRPRGQAAQGMAAAQEAGGVTQAAAAAAAEMCKIRLWSNSHNNIEHFQRRRLHNQLT